MKVTRVVILVRYLRTINHSYRSDVNPNLSRFRGHRGLDANDQAVVPITVGFSNFDIS